jgi:hypothetical protein
MGAFGARAANHAHDQAPLGGEELMREAGGNGRLGPQAGALKARRLELLCTMQRAREELGRQRVGVCRRDPRRRPAGTRSPGPKPPPDVGSQG